MHYLQVLSETIASVPNSAGVYKMFDAKHRLLYVGKAKVLANRLQNYLHVNKLERRIALMVEQIDYLHIITTNTEVEALLLEASIIKNEKPIYNIKLRDDKNYPYIHLDFDHPYPTINKLRGKQLNKYTFGPFVNKTAVQQAIDILQKVFLLRSCSDGFFANRTRPCIQYDIKRCSAPCVEKISQADYRASAKQALEFLRGNNKTVQQQLLHEMEGYSAALAFEQAAKVRDKLRALQQVQARNAFQNHGAMNLDVIAFYQDENNNIAMQIVVLRNGHNYGNKVYFAHQVEKEGVLAMLIQYYQSNVPAPVVLLHGIDIEISICQEALMLQHNLKVQVKSSSENKALHDLADFAWQNARLALESKLKKEQRHKVMFKQIGIMFGIENLQRIELYDNSHISGSAAVGCMVVATPEGFMPSEYRRYNMDGESSQDDFAMMRMMLSRRLQKMSPQNNPELIIIDGGIGQLNAVLPLFAGSNIVVVGMSKGVDRNAGREFFHQDGKKAWQLPKGDPVLLYLHSLRDEVHRFAITSHRKKRSKQLLGSRLDDIIGIGDKRKQQLLLAFGSVEGVMQASASELEQVVGKKIAGIIIAHKEKY